jgi:hypothetical protein
VPTAPPALQPEQECGEEQQRRESVAEVAVHQHRRRVAEQRREREEVLSCVRDAPCRQFAADEQHQQGERQQLNGEDQQNVGEVARLWQASSSVSLIPLRCDVR